MMELCPLWALKLTAPGRADGFSQGESQKGKRVEGQSLQSAAPAACQGGRVCNELGLTLQRRRDPHQGLVGQPWDTHRSSFKTALLALTADHSPPTTHSARGEGKWPTDWRLTAVLLKPALATTNQQSWVLDFLSKRTFLPGKPRSLPCAEWPVRLAVHTKETRKQLPVVNSQLRRQTAINIYDGKFHYLKILL